MLLAFTGCPAGHHRLLRTMSPIESTFATVGLWRNKTRGRRLCLARITPAAFHLAQPVSKG